MNDTCGNKRILKFLFLFVFTAVPSVFCAPASDPLSLLEDPSLVVPALASVPLASGFESRIFKKTLVYHLSHRPDEEARGKEWARRHTDAVSMMGDFILGQKGFPKNIALGRISYHSRDGTSHSYDFPLFFMSGFQQKPSLRVFKKAVQNLLPDFYHGYEPAYLGESLDSLTHFNTSLCEIFDQSSQSRCRARSEMELKRYGSDYPFPLYFAHSEQAIYFYLRTNDSAWTHLFSSYPGESPISFLTLNILTYYDPCIRCGDTGYVLSETLETSGVKKSLLDFFKQKMEMREANGLLNETKLFIQITGIKGYVEQTIPTTPLRHKRKEHPRYGSPVVPHKMIPHLCCVAREDLEGEDEEE